MTLRPAPPFVGLTAAATLFAAGAAAAAEGDRTRPNVVFLFADDLGYGDVACHRDEAFRTAKDQPNGRTRRSDEWRGDVRTPHLDRLAREGTDFQQFMVASPVCSPSRVAAMTGRFPSRYGVHQHFATPAQNAARGMPDWLPLSAPFLPRQLRATGYRTAHFGKWHLGKGDEAPAPTAYGFDAAAVYTGPGPQVFDGTSYPARLKSAASGEAASYLSVAATDHALDFVRAAADAGAPFYLNLWLHETHHEVTARPEDRAGLEDVPEPYQTYFGAVQRMDAQVGRVLDLLDELGLAGETLVIFSSDNGPENHTPRLEFSVGSPAGMRGRKRSLMMGGLNVPFLVRWPGVVPAGRVDAAAPLAAVDLMPTLLAATGAPAPEGYEPDGENVLPALRGEPWERSTTLYWYWQGNHGGDNWPHFAVRRGELGLLVDPDADRVELYDVVADRFQRRDLSEQRPEATSQLLSALDAWVDTLPPLTEVATNAPPAPRARPAAGEPVDRRAAFRRKDRDGDGSLSFEEYARNLRGGSPDRRFRGFDANGDGRITLEEFAE